MCAWAAAEVFVESGGIFVIVLRVIFASALVTAAASAVSQQIDRHRAAGAVADALAEANDERGRAAKAELDARGLREYLTELEKRGESMYRSREKFRHAAFHDPLSGLPNRTHFIETLKPLLGDPGQNFAVMFLDLNRFKTMNDSLGQAIGDRLIQQVGKRLKGIIGAGDLVGRFGGDEFAIIKKDIDTPAAATAFADRIADRIAEPFVLLGKQVFTSVSIGIAFGKPSYVSAEEILRDADIAMYNAKENQRRHEIFDQRMHTRAVERQKLESGLRHALNRDELEVYYQPIMRMDEVTISGFEALVRWNHPTDGLIMPNDFTMIAEDTGLMVPMTLKVLEKACRQLVYWQARSPRHKHLTMSVNISGKHFSERDMVGQIKAVLAATGVNPRCLVFEITESAAMENAEQAIEKLREIKETGVRISIDDFGTGYSSLSHLHRLPIDSLKIDRSFVSTMEDGSENGEIVRTIIALAAALKLSAIAEGIETIHQLHQLRILGCEYGQGFLFSKPMPARDIDGMFEDKTRRETVDLRPPAVMVTPGRGYTEISAN